ncbi:hypothetical protein [Endozoicomonas sp. SCSIO W0465]|uniref:hypothetical protein n=1 Tax=Endozoicomonas sp. SCSIO W0465 TaxID=2918516 RepID=UPI002074AC06|nr:hypothetical protein [Endozoicomonas sp. SCSIO W0465]USE37663.1 hypothetical protein MJO57_05505 [Endozoicomonas sp. SCSIO W0465]
MIYNAFRKLLAKYCQALPQEDSSLIYEISSLQYEKSLPSMISRLGRAAVNTAPMPDRLLKLPDVQWKPG